MVMRRRCPKARAGTAAALAVALAATVAIAPGAAAETLVIAHRGASGYLPEHTLAAEALAHGLGADFIEQDVVLTRDGVPIVLHDIHLDTTTDVAEVFPGRARADGRTYAIDFTLDEIRRLSARERIDRRTGRPVFPARFPHGRSRFPIPTLAESLELVRGLNASTGREVGVYPEIKDPAFHRAEGQDISRVVLETLAAHGYVDRDDRFYVQCFDWNEVQRIRRELGFRGRLVQLLGENRWRLAPDVDYDRLRTPAGLAEIAAVADAIGPPLQRVASGVGAGRLALTTLVADAHAAGLAVHPYTFRVEQVPDGAGSFEDWLRAFGDQARVDGVFTDFPDRAAAALRR